jgi:hypothetical protein
MAVACCVFLLYALILTTQRNFMHGGEWHASFAHHVSNRYPQWQRNNKPSNDTNPH